MSVLDRIPVDAISTKARSVQVDPVRVLLTLLALPFLLVGWSVGRAWVAMVWAAAAVQVGFDAGTRQRSAEDGG